MIAEKFTPEVLISAPRRGPAIPNHNGTLALYTESTHIDGRDRKEFHLLDIATGVSRRILHDDLAYEPTWLGDGTNTVVYLRRGGMGVTFILTIDVDKSSLEPSIAGHIRVPVRCLKTKALGTGILAFTVVGYADTDGRLLNIDRMKFHGGRVYTSYPLRPGDLQREPHEYTIWYSTLSKQDDTWRIDGDLHNALVSTDIHLPQETGCYGDLKNQYDLCKDGIVITAYRDLARSDTTSIYFVRVHSFETGTQEAPKEIKVQNGEYPSLCILPHFSPDGSMISFVRRERWNRERSQIYVYHTLESQSAISVFTMVTGRLWHLDPTSFCFSPDGHSLYVTAEDCGQVGLYHLNLLPNAYPRPLLRNGAVSAFYPLGQGDSDRVVVTSSSFTETCLYQIVSLDSTVEPAVLSSASVYGAKLGLSPNQVSEMYFEGSGNYVVHAWVVRPRHFQEGKKFPLAILVHDGAPISSWLNTWNMKWNAAVWAEQGYVVVLPNITGSTGYGQDVATAIHDDWSGRPYNDLVNCIYSLRNMPGVDVDNAVIAGAGYGGYLMNWIQGHPLSRRFKAMVCHAGIFNTQSIALQSNALKFNGDAGGLPISEASAGTIENCNPARPDLVQNWKTPMLVIHNERDFATPVSESLGTYNNLQSLGVPSKFLTFTDEGHDIVKEGNLLVWHREVFAWINRFISITTEETVDHTTSA
ncbi:prolyl oligopeptidase [Nemania sp. FL0031]|nr:prolyl oligopeptidase [Nemania sp. FL0031]